MKWALGTAALATVLFVGINFSTRDIWLATNVAGVVCLAYLIVVAVGIVRLFDGRTARIAWATILLVLVISLTGHWVMMWRMTTWQATEIVEMQPRMFHEIMTGYLLPGGVRLFGEYKGAEHRIMLDTAYWRLSQRHAFLPDTGGLNVTISQSVRDSSVEVFAASRFTAGRNPAFVNHDGRSGFAQDVMRVSTKGVDYEVQN